MSMSDLLVITHGEEKHAWYVDSAGYEPVDHLLPKQPERNKQKSRKERGEAR